MNQNQKLKDAIVKLDEAVGLLMDIDADEKLNELRGRAVILEDDLIALVATGCDHPWHSTQAKPTQCPDCGICE